MAKKNKENYGYKGNLSLKPINQTVDWTQETLYEYTKCATDIKYFINNYVKIENVDEGLIKFKLRDYQHRMVDSIVNSRYSIFLCSRQIGKCQLASETITIKNKTTGEIMEVPIGDFYKNQKQV